MGFFSKKEKTMPFPPNRFLQFFYLIKENFILLFYTSITYFIFTLPLIYVLLSTYIRYTTLINTTSNGNELYKTLINGGLLVLPSMLILSIATVGMHNVIKKISYNEPTGYKDFFIGIKENFLKLLPMSFVDSVFSSLIIINYAIYLFADINPLLKLFTLIISVIMFILIKLAKPFYMAQQAIFENSKIQLIKNSLAFATVKLIKNIGSYLLSNLLLIILFFLPNQMRVIDMVIMIILGGAYTVIIAHLNSLSVIENYINKDEYQNIYHKGLSDFYNEENL